jgi:aspartate aminotransferase
MELSTFASSIEPSATLAAGAKAKELKAAGKTVFDFSLGEPDFNTPDHICQAAVDAMKQGHTHYTPASGVPVLKQAICDYHLRQHGLKYQPTQICVSSGAKHTIMTALYATLNPGDQVVIPAPYWVSYSEMVKMTGAEPVIVPTPASNKFKLTAEQFRKACSPRTKMLMLNSPSNPTGSTYSPDELAALADVALEKNLMVMSDEIYERLIYGDCEFRAFAGLKPGLMERTLTVNGVSKTYAMTGWRIGWTAGPVAIIKAMGDIQSQQTSNPCSVSQYAAVAALNGDQTCIEAMKKEFSKRRDYVVGRISKLPGVSLVPPDGAFYAFFDVSSYFGKTFGGKKVANSQDFCMAALEQAHVVFVQGSAFGAEGYARMSFATSLDVLDKGLTAFEAWLATAK